MPKAVGIDLGTTNSVISVLEGGEPVVVPNVPDAKGLTVKEAVKEVLRKHPGAFSVAKRVYATMVRK